MPKVIVIGSGFGGLGAAARIASHPGYEVEIFEKRDKPGGRGYVYEIDGFKFDGGPTVITAPFMFDDIFAQAGRNREDYVQFVPCDPFYRIFDHTGRAFNYNGDAKFILSQIDEWAPEDREGYQRFIATTKPIFEKGFVELADQPFLKFGDMLRIAPDLIRLQSYKTVYQYVASFVKNDFLRRCFSFHPLLVGGNPFDTTSIYAMIHYLEREWGVFFALGGTGAIVNALVNLIQELGGQIHLDTEVEEILVQGRRTRGVRLKDGSVHKADFVISNVEAAYMYLNMIKPEHRRRNAAQRPGPARRHRGKHDRQQQTDQQRRGRRCRAVFFPSPSTQHRFVLCPLPSLFGRRLHILIAGVQRRFPLLEVFQANQHPLGHRAERLVGNAGGQARLLADEPVDLPQQRAAPAEHRAVVDQVGR